METLNSLLALFDQYLALGVGALLTHWKITLGVLGGLFVLGIILGMAEVVIVYRDFTDVSIVGLTVILPIAAMFMGMNMGATSLEWLAKPVFWFEIVMLVVIFIRTAIDNRNPFKTLLAFYVKVPLGVLFAVNVVELFTNEDRQNRRLAGFFVLLLAGFLIALVAEKRGLLAPTAFLRRHGVSQRT